MRTNPPEQMGYVNSTARFNVVPAGRRSGKTERAKRKWVRRALREYRYDDARYFFGAPTRDQAKAIFWADLKALTKPWWLIPPRESDLVITLVTGAELCVVGMDKPERIEGRPWNGGVLDEFANMKKEAWTHHVRPALSDRGGGCDFIGVPEGRNHYWNLWQVTRDEGVNYVDWAGFTWHSAAVLPPEEVESARRDLDELTFKQEYEGSFVSFSGLAYYNWTDANCDPTLMYDPALDLIFCFDFNVSPGIAAVLQEQPLYRRALNDGTIEWVRGTAVVGEVWIERNSNTTRVCAKLAEQWGKHSGRVICYGDATGGAEGSAKVAGSDWDIIRDSLRPVFGDHLRFDVPESNPRERARVNAVCTRMKSADGTMRLRVNPREAPHVVTDFEGVRCTPDGSGALDKTRDPMLTHLSDAIGYYIARRFPISEVGVRVVSLPH
jgi:hypothetical protein